MKVFSVRGVEIVLRPISILFFGCAFFFFDQNRLMLSFVSLFCHELSHVIMARLMGVRVESIEVMPYGGMARMDESFELDPLRELMISLAGPMCNIWLIVNALAANELWPQTEVMLRSFIRSNMYIALINLIPALPLDGGRALRAVLSFFIKAQKATRIASVLGMLTGIGLFWLGIASRKFGKANLTLLLTGLGIFFASIREYKSAKLIGAKKLTAQRPKVRGVSKINHIAVNLNEPTAKVLANLKYGGLYEISVIDEDQIEKGRISGNQLYQAVLKGARTMSQTLAK